MQAGTPGLKTAGQPAARAGQRSCRKVGGGGGAAERLESRRRGRGLRPA
ncbi:MAG TPA: hypothetical protein PLX18_00665 [Anaerohalosphaeraceae bacterium]|nr:hypothetical protein [Anaerohalosphaeraceae bacterium]HQG04813.1 hypothetical protein [Anaerohalosphaeraceae bacterium]HQI06357.1 hypothetical protein [Anaerohalosphaeraceae bacterium]HQJ66909.1 hypothetical protein [Anaerohalosphaeraceae bacterium]